MSVSMEFHALNFASVVIREDDTLSCAWSNPVTKARDNSCCIYFASSLGLVAAQALRMQPLISFLTKREGIKCESVSMPHVLL
jgi:hypothetical protein